MPFLKLDIHADWNEKQRELLDICYPKAQNENDEGTILSLIIEDKSMSLEDNMEFWDEIIQFVKDNPDCSLDDVYEYSLILIPPPIFVDADKWIEEVFVPQIENESQKQELDALKAWADQDDEDNAGRWDILLDFAYDDPKISLKDLLRLYHRIKNDI